jgi:hypothetical protein
MVGPKDRNHNRNYSFRVVEVTVGAIQFRSMKSKYYRPADLIADIQSRRFFKLETTTKCD